LCGGSRLALVSSGYVGSADPDVIADLLVFGNAYIEVV
jgi:hypothetical protein